MDALGRQQESGPSTQQDSAPSQTPAVQLERETSPPWDIELDENFLDP